MASSSHLLPDAQEFARMETALFDRLERGHRRKVVSRRLGALGVVVLLSGGTVAAATVANTPSQTNLAYCYPTSDGSGAATSVASAADQGKQLSRSAAKQTHDKRVRNAVERCAGLWRAGVFSPSGAALERSPRLQACITNSQVIAVYPNRKSLSPETLCGNLGLSAP